jgi:hypothetical protein
MSACYHEIASLAEPQSRLDEAIRRTIARAIETGELLDVPAEAERLAADCPDIGGTKIADLLIAAGVEARVNLALGPGRANVGGRTSPMACPASGREANIAAGRSAPVQ